MSNTETSAEDSKLTSFVSHLIELRDRLLRMVIAVGAVFIILAPFAKHVYDIFAAPLTNTGVQMISISVAAPFLVPYKLTLMLAFLIALPYVFYQAWQFIAPGLYKHEKRLVVPLLGSSVILFYLGVLFAYFVLLKMMFTVIPMFLPESAVYSPDIGEYLDFVMMMFIAFGFSFEMPIATILLISTGTTTAESLAKKRPYVIVGAFVVGMILTPPDVISQILLAVPMWLLFELGLFLSKFFNQRIKEAGEARETMNKEAREKADLEALEAGDDSLDRSPAKAAGAVAGTAAATSIADQANALWSDSDESGEDYTDAEEQRAYEAFEEYNPRSEEDLDAELDAIEAEEFAAEQAALDAELAGKVTDSEAELIEKVESDIEEAKSEDAALSTDTDDQSESDKSGDDKSL
ncbi:twin-arginine translocase subunit TatC [Leucothrix pacifica]|uniref:Sec-independent protein translocase protein TatC n=1 Tax=Leucothrix pacifica TaxID=1247513 RepID=A0A317CN26_9GAMM|nr:twin-arginine translocase subunit TatC [Leucothrix pacifica]PWQ99924.1 twin-arginine translocase subunit TatC [Leucothrix pacifica]